jgi:hypothetical protein
MMNDMLPRGVADSACVDPALVAELRMLCRGLAHSSLPFLARVRTIARLPSDEASERALRQACGELAAEFDLEAEVHRDGDAWAVCFSRPAPDEPATAAERIWAGRWVARRARLAWLRAARRPA